MCVSAMSWKNVQQSWLVICYQDSLLENAKNRIYGEGYDTAPGQLPAKRIYEQNDT